MPCHAIGHQVLSTLPLPKEAEDFPRGGKHPKDVRVPKCLDCLQPIQSNILDWHLNVSKPLKFLLVVKVSVKKDKKLKAVSSCCCSKSSSHLIRQPTYVFSKIDPSKNTFSKIKHKRGKCYKTVQELS